MSGSDPKTWLDRAIGACFGTLLGAIALYVAVALIQSIWPFLVAGLGVLTITWLTLRFLWSRRENRW